MPAGRHVHGADERTFIRVIEAHSAFTRPGMAEWKPAVIQKICTDDGVIFEEIEIKKA